MNRISLIAVGAVSFFVGIGLGYLAGRRSYEEDMVEWPVVEGIVDPEEEVDEGSVVVADVEEEVFDAGTNYHAPYAPTPSSDVDIVADAIVRETSMFGEYRLFNPEEYAVVQETDDWDRITMSYFVDQDTFYDDMNDVYDEEELEMFMPGARGMINAKRNGEDWPSAVYCRSTVQRMTIEILIIRG